MFLLDCALKILLILSLLQYSCTLCQPFKIMSNPGRRLDEVSKYFHRDATLRLNVKGICKGFGKTMQYIPERLKSHVKGCDKAKTLFEVDREQSSEGQPPQKKPALLQAKLPLQCDVHR